MPSSQPPKPPGLPNPYAIKPGVLPNPYALPAQGAQAVPAAAAEEPAKAEEKKPNAFQFHNPHAISRPQAKGSNANANRLPTIARAPIASSSSPAGPAAAKPAQRSIEYYRSTIDDDNAIIEQGREMRQAEKQRKKDEKKIRKKYGNWWPNHKYTPAKRTKINTAINSGFCNEGFRDFDAKLHSIANPPTPRGQITDSSNERRGSSSRPQSSVTPANLEKSSSPLPQTKSPLIATSPSAPHASSHQLSKAPRAPPPPPPTVETAPEETMTPPPPPPPPEPYNPTISAPPVRYSPTISAPPVRYSPTISAPPVRYSPTISAPPVRYSTTISADPVYYAQPAPPVEADEPPRPQKKQKVKQPPKPSKAAAMMAKMGYVAGQGLGKNNDGVTTHLEVKARKDIKNRQMRDEFEGDGKTIKAQQVFDITGGMRNVQEDHGKFGEPSRVVVTWGCVDGVDFNLDAERDDGGIRQEMGDIFNSKFGIVERIYINMEPSPATVYIQFRDLMCALNAVNRFHEGYEVRGRKIRAEYYNEKLFDRFIYNN